MSLTNNADGTTTLTRDRLMVCLEVAWEIEALAKALPGVVPNIDKANGAHHVVRGIAGRIKQLAEVLNAGLSDSAEDTDGLNCTVMVTGDWAAP